MNLYRQHFYQCIQVLRQANSFKIPHPRKDIKLPKKCNFITVYLDLDADPLRLEFQQIHSEIELPSGKRRHTSSNELSIQAGIRVRPFCRQFLQQLAQFAEIIIFTASCASYADVILDYLDPEKKFISHRLYRQHCTL